METKLLGRYELIDPTTNTRKFWHIVLDRTTQTCFATWGRIGCRSPEPVVYDLIKAMKKVKEKMKKGYSKVGGYEEAVGSKSIHFVKKMCQGEAA